MQPCLKYSHHCPESLRDGVEVLEVGYNGEKGQCATSQKLPLSLCMSNGRGDWIRTSDLLNPIQVR